MKEWDLLKLSNKPTIRPINEACKVKNTSLFYNYETETYHLVHYDTEILTVKQGNGTDIEITKCLKCSNSSTRAIYQVADFLDIDHSMIKEKMQNFDKFHKYNMSTMVNKTKQQLSEVMEQ